MEKELNIAAILKEKPLYTKLWSDTFGDMFLTECSVDSFNVKGRDDNLIWTYLSNGTFKKYMGVLSIFPSKAMRSWEKFAWKKGDVLVNENGMVVMFDGWANDEYTEFNTIYNYYHDNTIGEEEVCDTSCFNKATKDIRKKFIDVMEKHYGGKLNPETLEIEHPKQEFKDGDIMYVGETKLFPSSIFIYKDDIDNDDEDIACHAHFDYDKSEVELFGGLCIEGRSLRPATDSEKQQLFSALAKENKRWNPNTLQIEDLPKMLLQAWHNVLMLCMTTLLVQLSKLQIN